MTNKNHNVLYTGVTSDLKKRAYQHREGTVTGFSSKYKTNILVYYEIFEDIREAIIREKQLKAGTRQKKMELINNFNSDWNDLYNDL